VRTVFHVFRGDPARIRGFDERKIRRGEYDRGFYFTDDPEVASRYGPVVDAYRVTLARPYEAAQFGFLRGVAGLAGEAAPSGMDSRARWVTETLRRFGHDGIVIGMVTGATYVVAFDPGQIERVEESPPPAIPEREAVRVRVRPRRWTAAF